MHDQLITTADLAWTAVEGYPGVERKLCAPGRLGAHTVSLVRLALGASLPAVDPRLAIEAAVLAGDWQLPGGGLEANGYARWPGVVPLENHTDHGCTLFVRSAPFDPRDTEVVHAPAAPEFWHPGQGNLRVRPLHGFGTEHTALVHWPAGERFVPHRHVGGEEIFVLSGVFEDEHGRYPQGSWMVSPHMSRHHPFVREETTIFVKVGHVPAMRAS